MEVFCSGRDEDDKSTSCGPGANNSCDQGVVAVGSQTAPGSPGLRRDAEDWYLEQLTEDEMHGPPLQTSAEDDVDESGVEEEDVKVCDICGDAGREDLLAVCSRCSDGAEHTYCMREMLDKVPEGDWLCEECKFNEEMEERKHEHSKMLGTNERSKSLGRTGPVNCDLSVKLDSEDPFCERSKMKNVSLIKQVPCKRSGDSFEAGPTSKRQALESSIGSPTTSSPSRVAFLSKDCSFKNLDKMKGKPTNQTSTGTESSGDSSEIARSLTTNSLNLPKGNFVKSNSFSSGNSKLNVKVSEEVLQKQRQGVVAEDGPGKLMAKSMSFKGFGRSSVSEPKVKMLSPKCTPVQELKGQRQGRERNSFERKNSIKDNSFSGQIAAITSKHPSRGDNISSLSVFNNRDYKNSQSDGKLTTLLKHPCHSVHKFSDSTANIGEVKRISSTSISGSEYLNGTSSSAEAKPSVVSLKEIPVLNSSRTADRSVTGANGGKADVLDNQNEKPLENSFGRSRQGVNAGLVGGIRRGHSTDASVSRIKEGTHEENKLKAAIEAAMQKKQDIFKKNRIPDKPNELSTSNTQGNHLGDAVLNLSSDVLSEEGMHEGEAALHNDISDSCKHTSIGSTKQLKVYPADFATSPIGESVLRVSAIPELESIWQGGFEIHRSGKFPDMCGGFQAHFSSIASDKVLEVVKKFPEKIVLDEVPRSCVWPVQFKQIGAREDNIALYFFAKDPESYLRSYKILLDYLMECDLALRGNINGVELLVFPSNHLPDKSRCWNTLFFMWGVFQGRRPLGPENMSGSVEMPEIPISNLVLLHKDVASSACPDDSCLHTPAMEDLSVSGSSHPVVSGCDSPASVRLNLRHSGNLSNGDCYNQRYSVGRPCSSSYTSTENPQRRPENHSPGSDAEACSESESAAVKDRCDQVPIIVIEHQQSTQEIDRHNNPHDAQVSPSYRVEDKQDMSSHSPEMPLVGVLDGGSVVSSGEQQVQDTVNNTIDDKVNLENSLKLDQGCVDIIRNKGCKVKLEDDVKQKEDEIDSIQKNYRSNLKFECSSKQERYVDINISAGSSMEQLSSLQFSPKRHLHLDFTNSISQAVSVTTSQKGSWMHGKDPFEGGDQSSTNKTIKGVDGLNGCDLYRRPSYVRESFSVSAQMHGVSTSSQREVTSSNKADDEEPTCANPGSAERYFFLVDSHPTQSIKSGDVSFPSKVALSENEDRRPDGSPNLELALGVEKKQSRSGVLPCFAGLGGKKDPDRPPDKEEDEDASASLSLSLAFPFSDKERSSSVEQTYAGSGSGSGRHEVNTSLLLFRGSSHK